MEQLRVLAAVRAVARRTGASEEATPRSWGHLRVLERIGRGAFGEVYRAWDTRLDREVALKLLPLDSTGADPASSIIEEGRLLARVRHPNVVTIYGAERIDHRIGLWMEFVTGRTLEEMLRDGVVFTSDEVVRLGIELCRAAGAVHEAGLLHRDIKAQNVMVADDGRLVLMDFGTGQESGSAGASKVAGTPLYLAPEVLAGGPPTAGSDVYSIGVLLYHLLTRAYPVHASTLAELRSAHEHGTRVDLRSARSDLPRRLARVIERAVDRHKGRRYADAEALASDLSAIRTRSRSARAAALSAVTLAILLALWGGESLRHRVDRASSAASSQAVLPASSSMVTGATPVLSLRGETFTLAVSPDARQVAFVWAPTHDSYLYLNRLGNEAVVQLTHTPGSASFPVWSPDGRSIAFRHLHADVPGMQSIRVVPSEGGAHRTVWSGDLILGRGLDWSPDGADLVSAARTRGTRGHGLVLFPLAGGEIEWLTSAVPGADDGYPVFSPDGRTIAFVRNAGTEPGIYLYRLDRRDSKRLMAAQSALKRLAWSPGGESLFFASGDGPGHDTIWKLSVAGGQVEALSGTGTGASEPSVAKGASRLVFLQGALDQNLYRARLSAGSPASIEQLPGTIRSETHPDLSPDASRLAFMSDRTGYSEIWTADPDGADPKPLTSLKTMARHPRWAPDGRRLVFVGLEAGPNNHDLYVVDSSGSGMRRLTEEPSTEQWPTWSRDGQWIYFTSDRTGTWQVWKVPAAGGAARQITGDGGLKGWESPDGKFVFYAAETGGIWRMPVAGGAPERLFDFPRLPSWGGEWVPADRGIFFLNAGASRQSTIELFDFATRRISTMLTLPGLYDGGSGFTVSPDGSWLVLPQRDVARSEIMLMPVAR